MYHETKEAPSWILRGHTRKPNVIVRGLYCFFDWLGDFVPMFSALFGRLGRFSLVLVNLIILIGVIIMSAAHSLQLLRYAGLSNGLEWVGVISWELVFIFSSILLANDFRRGNWRSGWATWAGFSLGFAFVEVSNVMGMANNEIGIAIGICTPVLLLVSKGLLAHQFKRRTPAPDQKQELERQEKTSEPETPEIEKPEESASENANAREEDQDPEQTPAPEQAPEETPTELTQALEPETKNANEETTAQEQEEALEETLNAKTETPPESKETPNAKAREGTPESDTTPTPETEPTPEHQTTPAPEPEDTKPEAKRQIGTPERKSQTRKNVIELAKKTPSQRQTQRQNQGQEMLPVMIEYAKAYFETNGKNIGRDRLAAHFNVKPYWARKALDKLKEQTKKQKVKATN